MPSPISSSQQVMVVVTRPVCGPQDQQGVGGGDWAQLQLVVYATLCLKPLADSHCLLIQKIAPGWPWFLAFHSLPDGY